MTGQSSILMVVLLPWLTLVFSESTATPYVTFDTGSSDARENAGVRMRTEGQPPQQQRNPAPTRFYRTLSRRSVGRYVLATSSLVGECARVYAPAPLGNVATSFCNRFNMSLTSHGRGTRPSSRQKKASGLSYDRFMSQLDGTVDDLCVNGDATGPVIPPNKYSRVSSSFLMRHGIGLEKAGQDSGDENPDALRPPAVKADESSSNQRSKDAVGFTQLRTRKARNVFKSLAGLGRGSTIGVGDDLELLSDLEEEREWDERGERGDPNSKDGWAVEDMPVGTAGEDVLPGDSRFRRTRNLVDNGSDDFSTLVKKLRLAEKAKGVSHNRRKNRRSKKRKDETA